MGYLEKINLYVSEDIASVLDNDARTFEILKSDLFTPNRNRFLSMLIVGYHEQYTAECKRMRSAVSSILSEVDMDDQDRDLLSDKIINSLLVPEAPVQKRSGSVRLSLKPTASTEPIIQDLLLDLNGDSISHYFSRMLASYCKKSFSERERIIFMDQYERLLSACKSRSLVSFHTVWNKETIRRVVPYCIKTSLDEHHNYLLCVEIDEDHDTQTAMSFRLNRIRGLHTGRHTSGIKESTIRHLDQMIRLGAQYMINDDVETCVRLTDTGIALFNRIYQGRPVCERIEHRDGFHFYFFNSSVEQLYYYFRRINASQAEVLYPQSLREKIAEFHRSSLEVYAK